MLNLHGMAALLYATWSGPRKVIDELSPPRYSD